MKNKVFILGLMLFLMISFSIGQPVVTLTTPTNNTLTSSPLHFIIAVTGDNITNCSLYGNWDGVWESKDLNIVAGAGTKQFSKIDVPEGTYLWNTVCYNATGTTDWANTNNTIRIYKTFLGNDLSGVKGLMKEVATFIPVIVDVVVSMIPVIFIFLVVGWFTGMFDNILGAMGMTMLKRR